MLSLGDSGAVGGSASDVPMESDGDEDAPIASLARTPRGPSETNRNLRPGHPAPGVFDSPDESEAALSSLEEDGDT